MSEDTLTEERSYFVPCECETKFCDDSQKKNCKGGKIYFLKRNEKTWMWVKYPCKWVAFYEGCRKDFKKMTHKLCKIDPFDECSWPDSFYNCY